jgi:signal transduction histidine kinase
VADADYPWPALVSLAVHEMRTPVNVVSGYVRMLLEGHGGTLTAAQRHALEQAEASSTRLTALLAELGDIGRLETGRLALDPVPLDVADLLLDAARAYTVPAGSSARCVVAPAVPALRVAGDRARLAHAIAALAVAVARSRPSARDIVLGAVARTHDVALTVADADLDVQTEDLDQLVPLDECVGGLGLSLPLARRVVAASGGRVGVPADERHRDGAAAVVLPQA